MKNRWSKILLFFCIFGILAESLPAETVGKIVAIVNDEVITQQELEDVLRDFPEKENLQEPARREKALNRLVEDKLILQKAREVGVVVTPEEVDEVIRNIKNRFPSQEAFDKTLVNEGLTYKAFETRHKNQLIIKKMVTREIRSKSSVTPREVETYHQEHSGSFQGPEAWKLSHLLVRKHFPGKEDPERKKKAKQLLRRLRHGEDFKTLVRNYSEGPRKEEGGDLGYVERGKLMKEIEEALVFLPVGGISEIIETPVGYNIFRLEDRKSSEIRPFKQVREEIHGRLMVEKIKNRYNEWMKELKKDAYIQK